MIFQFWNGRLKARKLLLHRLFIIVIKAVALVAYPKAHHYRKSVFVRLVQYFLSIIKAPCPDGIATGSNQRGQVIFTPRTFYIIGLAIAQ